MHVSCDKDFPLIQKILTCDLTLTCDLLKRKKMTLARGHVRVSQTHLVVKAYTCLFLVPHYLGELRTFRRGTLESNSFILK